MKQDPPFKLIRLVLMFAVVIATIISGLAGNQRAAGAQGQPLEWDLSSESGPPGKKVTASSRGGGWPVGSEIIVEGRLQGSKKSVTLCKTTVRNNGQWSCNFKAPKSSDGKISITVTGDRVTSSETDTFNITEPNNGGGRKRTNNNDRNSLVPIPGPPASNIPRSHCDTRCQNQLKLAEDSIRSFRCIKSFTECRHIIPPGTVPFLPLPDAAERALTTAECIVTAIETFSLSPIALMSAAVSGCGDLLSRQDALPQPPLTIAPVFPIAPCFPGQVGTVTDCAENPSEQLRPNPAPIVPPISPATEETLQEINVMLESSSSMPSVSFVREQQAEVRNQVCANVPTTGAGGCPRQD